MIRFVFRWAFRLLILAIVLGVGLVLLKDTLAKSAAERRIREETGLEVRIGKIDLGLFTPTLSIQDLVIYNSAEFGGSPLIDVPDFHVEYTYRKLPLQKLHLKLLRLNLRELNIVESNQGRTNLVDILSKVAPQLLGRQRATNESSGFGGIDMLNLTVGKVRYAHLSNPRRNQEVNVAIQNAIIQNIRTEEDLAGVLLKVLIRAGITIYTDSANSKGASPRAAAAPKNARTAAR